MSAVGDAQGLATIRVDLTKALGVALDDSCGILQVASEAVLSETVL